MNNNKLADAGIQPTVTWDPYRRKFIAVWQDGARLRSNFGLSVDIVGAEGSFPRLYTWQRVVYLGYRDGSAPFTGWLYKVGASVATLFDPVSLSPVHGAYPCAFGGQYFAFQSDGANAGWPVVARDLETGQLSSTITRGVGTGLAYLKPNGEPVRWDDLRGVGLSDPTFAGGLTAGATDRRGQPVVVVRDGSGKELELWPGQDSQNPCIAQGDGNRFAVVAWSAAGQGVRLAEFSSDELVAPSSAEEPPPAPRTPRVTRPAAPKAFAWFYDFGRYGEFPAKRNGTLLGGTMLSDDQQRVAAAYYREAAATAESLYLAANAADFEAARSCWSKVQAVWVHEPDSASELGWKAADARAAMNRLKLSSRPVIGIVSLAQATSEYASACDALAVKIYFDVPAKDWQTQFELTVSAIASALVRIGNKRCYLISQSYDRSDGTGPAAGPWEVGTGRDQLTAIAQGCFDALTHPRVLGLFPFSLGRPGGASTYSELLAYYNQQAAVLQSPPLPKDSNMPAKINVELPNDQQNTNALQRISLAYVNTLKREHGIFDVPPDGLEVAITMPGNGNVRIDTKSLAVWLGRYAANFAQHSLDKPRTDHHEPAIVAVENALYNSDEARAHRPQ